MTDWNQTDPPSDLDWLSIQIKCSVLIITGAACSTTQHIHGTAHQTLQVTQSNFSSSFTAAIKSFREHFTDLIITTLSLASGENPYF